MRQFDLFTPQAALQPDAELPLSAEVLADWQQRVLTFQQQQRQQPSSNAQGSLFGQQEPSNQPPEPLSLPPQHLQFWRWPESLQQGLPSISSSTTAAAMGKSCCCMWAKPARPTGAGRASTIASRIWRPTAKPWCAAANSPASRSASGVMPRLMRAPADGWNNSKFAIGCRPLTRSAASAGRHRSRATSTNQAAPVRSRDQSVAPS